MKAKIGIWVACCVFCAVFIRAELKPDATPSFLKNGLNGAWVSARGAVVHAGPGGASRAVWKPAFGGAVEVVERKGLWAKVKNGDGREGWIENGRLSAKWILVEKKKRRLSLMEGAEELNSWVVDLGADPEGDKEMSGELAKGHYRTPEGEMYVCRKVPASQFYKAFLLSYPTVAHAARGLERKLITRTQYDAVVSANRRRDVPPQDTRLGGYVEIHGHGTGGVYDWTLGCVAVKDGVMDVLWDKVVVGTPVVVVP